MLLVVAVDDLAFRANWNRETMKKHRHYLERPLVCLGVVHALKAVVGGVSGFSDRQQVQITVTDPGHLTTKLSH